jgi:class 3 adenylate cyclase
MLFFVWQAADMALGMMRSLPSIRAAVERDTLGVIPGSGINIRIGLNSGPVAAGIVGIKNPRYDFFRQSVLVIGNDKSF